jgi:hypothetical protein
MEPEGLLLHSQEPDTACYPEPDTAWYLEPDTACYPEPDTACYPESNESSKTLTSYFFKIRFNAVEKNGKTNIETNVPNT